VRRAHCRARPLSPSAASGRQHTRTSGTWPRGRSPGGQIQKELISGFWCVKTGDQREEIIGTAIEINGKCDTKNKVEWSCSGWLKLQLHK
jgi:hypothetical protein